MQPKKKKLSNSDLNGKEKTESMKCVLGMPMGELTEGDAEVAEGTACDGHVDGKLGVAEGGQESRETGNGIGHHNGRARTDTSSTPRRYKDSRSDHPAEAEPDEVGPPEGLGHV